MIVYRIENERGIGPYRCQIEDDDIIDDLSELMFRHRDMSTHPSRLRDFSHKQLSNMDGEPFFGFDSMESLLKWFTPSDLELIPDSFSIVAYSVSLYDVQHGWSGKQLIFVKAKSEKIEAISIRDLCVV